MLEWCNTTLTCWGCCLNVSSSVAAEGCHGDGHPSGNGENDRVKRSWRLEEWDKPGVKAIRQAVFPDQSDWHARDPTRAAPTTHSSLQKAQDHRLGGHCFWCLYKRDRTQSGECIDESCCMTRLKLGAPYKYRKRVEIFLSRVRHNMADCMV